ncbi:MAG: helix-turn-helix domain-containing protein [Acidimicrobiales bacterium]
MDDIEQLARARTLRNQGCTPKQVARALGLASADAARLVRQVARDDAARAPEPPVAGCWVSPGWSGGLTAPTDWSDAATPDGVGNGLVTVLVARNHRPGKVAVGVYLVDVFCLGVKDTLGPRVIDDFDLRGFVRTCFLAYEAPPLMASIEMARELVLGSVDYARGLGFEPHPDFERTTGHLGVGRPTGAVKFGREGKPHFVQGIRDNPTRILATLERAVGEGNFNFLVAV